MRKGIEIKPRTTEQIRAKVRDHERGVIEALRQGKRESAVVVAHRYEIRRLGAELRKRAGKPGRITIAVVRAALRREGCTIEEDYVPYGGSSEFRVDPPAGMGFEYGEVSQRVFEYRGDVDSLDPESRISTLIEIYEWAEGIPIELAPWKGDGDYQDAIAEVLRGAVAGGNEGPGIPVRHVEARLFEARTPDQVRELTTDGFEAAVIAAYKAAVLASPAENDELADSLGCYDPSAPAAPHRGEDFGADNVR